MKKEKYKICKNLEKVYYADELYENTTDENKIKHNTQYLQELIDEASESGGGIVKIPCGIYYFASA